MFERKKYKSFAKKMLPGRWKVPVLMTLFIWIINDLFALPTLIELCGISEFQSFMNGDFADVNEGLLLFSTAANQTNSSFLLSLIQSVVEAILSFAALNVYLKMTRSPEKVRFSSFIEGFNNWWKALLGCLWQLLWIFMWSLLFFIPGLIKSIAYSQMYMIMNEFENVSVTKAMRISIIITRGHKWDLFVMYLSFIGWDLLGILTLGIGTLWIEPYKQVTYMNAFHALLKEALETNTLKPEDLQ